MKRKRASRTRAKEDVILINRVATFILIDPHHLVLLTSCTRTKTKKKNRVNLNVPLEAASTKTSVNKDVGVESVTFSGKTVHTFFVFQVQQFHTFGTTTQSQLTKEKRRR